ncbi:septin-8-A isoform X1 [Lates japonicus]|uniref:Septin-8-A isoform X1 n=1 Tax=Lates japonicus TaxID=270547 RepID=A0AAD3NFD5_LATJO|nr:septin-8-A isoform X1 [Lates japonicus]
MSTVDRKIPCRQRTPTGERGSAGRLQPENEAGERGAMHDHGRTGDRARRLKQFIYLLIGSRARTLAHLPFAVVGSVEEVKVGNKTVRARQYPWGVVQVENESHCDFVKLREMLIRVNMEDLREQTHARHSELCSAASSRWASEPDPDSQPGPDLQETYEAKRKEFLGDLQRKEEEMRQMFVNKVKETEAELKEKEREVSLGK